MSKIKKDEFVLVFDRYFSNKPNTAALFLKKWVYCCAECICMLFCLFGVYNIPLNPWIGVILCAVFTALFSALFSVVKKRYAIPAITAFGAAALWVFREEFWVKFTYFIDAVFRAISGIVFSMKQYLWHKNLSENVESEIFFTEVIIIFVFAVICAGSMFRKPTGIAPVVTFAVLLLPMIIAMNIKFNLWFIPTMALFVGGIAFSNPHLNGIITRGGKYSGCRDALKRENRSFDENTKNLTIIQRAHASSVNYTKYFSAAISAAAIFAAAGILGAAILPKNAKINYKSVVRFFESFAIPGQGTGVNDVDNAFEDYFTGASNSLFSALNVTSPGTSEREILNATNSGDTVYLRGDIGIEFGGVSWTTPLTSQTVAENEIVKKYRPVEMLMLLKYDERYFFVFPTEYKKRFPQSFLPSGNRGVIEKSSVGIEYKCNTNVVFLPAYTTEFSYYDNDNFSVFGDYIVRTKSHKIDGVRCTALVPYANYSGANAAEKERFISAAEYLNSSYNLKSDFGQFIGSDNNSLYYEYKRYIEENYLSVPEDMEKQLAEYIERTGLFHRINDTVREVEKYRVCVKIADYLKNNYKYSLETDNGTDNPVMQFLNNTKSGHCALYASAMTLIVRSLGIPARYCTGFIVPHTEEGEKAIVRSKNMHAWCEVYFEDIGWITFDPTSAAANAAAEVVENNQDGEGGSDESSVSGESSEISESSEDSESVSSDSEISDSEDYNIEDPDESNEDSEDTSGEENSNIEKPGAQNDDHNVMIIVVAAVLFAVAAAGVVIVIVRFVKFDKRAKKALENARTSGNCPALYEKITEIIRLCGFAQRAGEQPDVFYARVDRHFKTNFKSHSNLLLKAAFCEGKFTEKELEQMARLLESIFYAADKQLVLLGRIKLRRIILRK